ncbi:hypothetical protein V6615_00100 [Oscillospiraceae bacterium PP1C4]
MYLISAVLSFAGLAAALLVFVLNILCILRKKAIGGALFYLAISAFYGYTLVISLIRQSSGLSCAVSPVRTLLIEGVLLILHLHFAWDSLKALRQS